MHSNIVLFTLKFEIFFFKCSHKIIVHFRKSETHLQHQVKTADCVIGTELHCHMLVKLSYYPTVLKLQEQIQLAVKCYKVKIGTEI